MRPPPYRDESARHATLLSYEILDTPREEAFDDITRLVANLLDVPIALVSFIDGGRQWFKSSVGLELEETPRDVAFCAHALHEPQMLVVPDAREDPRFRDNPLVTGEPHIRFYAGAVLRGSGGHPLGTLCAIDREPRRPSDAALASLAALSRRVMSELELRRSLRENQRTTARLAHAETSLRLLVEQAPVGIFRTDAAGNCEYANSRAASMTGHEVSELLGRGWLQAVHPDDRPSVSDSLSRALRLGNELQFECRFLTADDRVRRLSCQATPLPSTGEAETPGYLGSLWDVTERHRTVQRLRESEARYRLLAEEASDLIKRQTPDGRLLYVSPASRKLLGREPEELEGHTLAELELVHPEDREELESGLRALRESNEDRVVTYRLRRRDGSYATFETSKRLVRDDAGRPLEIVSVSRDVSRQRSLEDQLRQAQKMEAIGQFAGGVAHDFNNVLTVILGHADVLETSLGSGTPEEADARAIRESAERAARLTRQLLAYTRRQVLEPRLVDLNQVIGEMESMLRRLLSEATRLVWEPGPDIGSVHVDRGQLEQVIMNLAVNARDALGHGGQLTLRTEHVVVADPLLEATQVPRGEWALLTVSDDGCGMDEATRRRAFEPFFTTKAREQGTGLGLATVYGIVKQSQGFIYVDSEPGRGTRFRIYLPMAGTRAPRREVAPTGSAVPSGSETVLIVEDQDSIRPIVERYLTRCGYRVLSAASAGEAEAIARSEPGPIDLLLTDVVLTDVSGPVLARRLRESRPGLRVLYMSGYAGGDLDEPEELERAGFLQKPFRLENLAHRVRETIATPARES